MSRRDEIAQRMADAVVKRLTTRKIVEVRDEGLPKVRRPHSPPSLSKSAGRPQQRRADRRAYSS
jgi:hypothetical protein